MDVSVCCNALIKIAITKKQTYFEIESLYYGMYFPMDTDYVIAFSCDICELSDRAPERKTSQKTKKKTWWIRKNGTCLNTVYSSIYLIEHKS